MSLLDKRLRVLLASADAGGTLAAVRQLGTIGIDVGVINSHRLGAAAWSRSAARSYHAPPENQSSAFLDRLLTIGESKPGQILLPTSDETAWLYTLNAAQLERYFYMYQPSVVTMQRILNKKQFTNAAAAAGINVLPSWDPSLDDLAALAPKLPYPILIKPRSHVHRIRNNKGVVANSPSELICKYRRFVAREQVRVKDPLLPDAGIPILQQFVSSANESVQSITGFIDRKSELFVTRRSRKVFQRSRPVGVGVCHEALPELPFLSHAVRQLCKELGYFGIFEVEFVWFEGTWAAIDFNPRFYNQMGLDIGRGMQLPLLACLGALGETEALRNAIAQAQVKNDAIPTAFCDRFTFCAMLLALVMSSRLSGDELAYWRAWLKRNAVVDVALDRNDLIPGLVHAFSEIYLGVRAFPRFLRSGRRESALASHAVTRVGS